MNINSHSARRFGAIAAAVCAAILIPAVALAAPGRSATHQSATAHSATAQSATAHSATARSAGATRASAPGCSAADLVAWVGVPGNGSAGSVTYQLELSNVSGHACSLLGFPGVSALSSGDRQLGSAAVRNDAHPPQVVTIGRRGTAHVELRITDVGNYPASACHPVTAHGLRIYPPDDRRSEVVPFTFRACQKRGPKYLGVSTTIPGTGIPSFSS